MPGRHDLQPESESTSQQCRGASRDTVVQAVLGALDRAGEDPVAPNTSGTAAPPPDAVVRLGLCWPAVVLTPWFSLANQIPWSEARRPRLMLRCGYALAWRHRHWEDLELFSEAMGAWRRATAATVMAVIVVVAAGGGLAWFLHSLSGPC